ncbi:MAG: hypothetical protein AB7F59_03445 [Bdellovibrionales bacterium]
MSFLKSLSAICILSAFVTTAHGQQQVERRLEVGSGLFGTGTQTESVLIKVNFAKPISNVMDPKGTPEDQQDELFKYSYFLAETEVGFRDGKMEYTDIQISPIRGQNTINLSESNNPAKYYMEVTLAPVTIQRDTAVNMAQRYKVGLAKMRFTFISPELGGSLLGARAYAGFLGSMMDFGYSKTTDGIEDSNVVGGIFNLSMGYEAGVEVRAFNDNLRLRIEPYSMPTRTLMGTGDGLQVIRRALSLDIGKRVQLFVESKDRKYYMNHGIVNVPETSPFATNEDGSVRAKDWFAGVTVKLGKKLKKTLNKLFHIGFFPRLWGCGK